ncbi:MAG: hypothetical protein QXM12_07820 [Nitrososphaerota archaeon]
MFQENFTRNFIHNIMVIGGGGICLASAVSGGEQLVGGLISAIMSFSRSVIGSEIEFLEFKDRKVYFVVDKEKDVCVAAILSEKLPEALIKFILEDVLNVFLSKYGNVLENWNGDLSVFNEMNSYLKSLVSKPFMETVMRILYSRSELEGIVLYDFESEKFLFSVLPDWFSSRRKLATVTMAVNFANKLSEELRGGKVDVVVLRGEEKWIVVVVRGKLCLMALTSRRTEYYDASSVVAVAGFLLDYALKISKEGGESEPKKENG